MSPAHTCKEALPVASNSRLALLHATEQAKELCHEFQSPRCTFAISIATAKLATRVVASRACYYAIRKEDDETRFSPLSGSSL